MNQQFSVEYLGVKPGRYNRLPTLHTNHIFNLSQELQTSRTKRNLLKPKLQALSHKREDSKNFYHHTTIYNVKEFKELNKVPNVQEQNFAKYTELQTKLMVADFKKKVDAFLTKNNYKHNLMGSKITSSLKELESFQSTNNEEQLNRSLCSNKYTIRTEYKSMKAMEIFVIGNNKIVARQVISSELIQQRLLKQMENFLKDERYNYDLKMQTMIDEYEDIVSKIREQTHTIKIPDKYIIQMSDYNEYYQMKEDPAIDFLKNKLDIIADQIIQEIQQSKKTTPRIQSNHTSEQMDIVVEQSQYIQQIEDIIKTEPVYTKDEEDKSNQQIEIEEYLVKEKKTVTQKKPRTKKKLNQSNRSDRRQSEIGSSQSELNMSIQQSQVLAEVTRRKKEPEPPRQIEVSIRIAEEEQDQFQANVMEDQKIQEVKKKREEFNNKYKPKTHSRRVTEDVVMDRQDPIILAVPKEQLMDTLSERAVEDLEPIEDIIRVKKEELYQFQIEQALNNDQVNEKTQEIQQGSENGSKAQSPGNKLKPPEVRDAADLWDSLKNSPRSVFRQRNNHNQIIQKHEKPTHEEKKEENPPAEIEFPKDDEQDQQKQENQENQEKKQFETVNSQQTINYYKIIEQKMKVIEENLMKNSLDIIDILLASKIVYDVDIENYKIGKPNTQIVNHPSFVFQSEKEENVFVSQVLWRREVLEVIPRMNEMNRFKVVQLDEFDDYVGEPPNEQVENDIQKIEEKQNESDDNDNS